MESKLKYNSDREKMFCKRSVVSKQVLVGDRKTSIYFLNGVGTVYSVKFFSTYALVQQDS